MSEAARLRRRGLLLPSLVALAAFLVLLGLGLWQVARLEWKENLIATLAQRSNATPVPLPPSKDWPELSREDAEFRRVAATVEFLDRPHAYVYTGGSALRPDVKAPGYFVFAPARLATGEVVAVNAGYVPERGHPIGKGKTEIVGYLRWPEPGSLFVSDHDASGSVWHVRDHRLMARRLQWDGAIAPFYIDQESPVPTDGLPRPGPLTVKLRNDHLGYAITWFGLAAVLLIVFGSWAVSRVQRSTTSA